MHARAAGGDGGGHVTRLSRSCGVKVAHTRHREERDTSYTSTDLSPTEFNTQIMSISRKNWSALSTLARQWTVEDEEEVEREKRRKTRESTADMDESPTEETKPQTSSGPADAGDSGGGLAQLQMDFVEMLRVRDERRRMRHVETLRKNKEEDDGGKETGPDAEPHVELLGDQQDEELFKNIQRCVETFMSAEPPTNSRDSETQEKQENGGTNQDSTSTNSQPPSKASRKFVSSLSISFDKSPTSPSATSRLVSPLSPKSPPPQSPRVESPRSPTHSGSMSPTPNGDAARHENGSPSNFEPAAKPAFTRQSSRTVSFRMVKKKEEGNMPLQRSASVRIAAKTFESNKSSKQEEEQKTPFQRNSRQRLSSRSIQEKMERLAQASQKWEISKSPVVHQTVCLADEVSRKRELFEKEQEGSDRSHVFSKQEFRSFSSGLSDRINRWVQKKTFTVSSSSSSSSPSHSPLDLRLVSISSKKSLFERGQDQDNK
ncbi:ladinin-1 [Sinocyclocheilus rhinocerous]|uniref:ladinin-1 n=1 Tax=Sinocyclocheilus rhinocerous TaxID=307959 RepID=UPI0007B894A8|nr:PREDICTED: ladinin-1-like [Sinocyclocheilus rhinocerous]